MAVQENIKVYARVRPFSEWIGNNQKSCLQTDTTNSEITVKTTTSESKFTLDGVFDETATQEAIYDRVSPSVSGFLDGINGTIFAYGQTGSGKTYTMLGPEQDETDDQANRGIIPRAVEDIFAALKTEHEQKPETFKFSMKCSFVELYNEKLYDLLQDDNDAIIKIHASLKEIVVVGAAEFEVTTYEECIHHLWRGWNQRAVAETKMNRESSRSHAVFMLTLVTEHIEGTVINRRSSRLNLVDLAGSERQGQTKNTGQHLKEAGNINKSLSILARVIRSLSAKQTTYVSYRDSPLTLLLRDSLGGNARAAVVVNIHPNFGYAGDTISTLNFAANVKKVKNTAQVNEAISGDDVKAWSAEIGRLRKENGELKAEKSTWAEERENFVVEIQKLQDSNTSLQSQVSSFLSRSVRRTGFAAMLEHDSEDVVPGKINFDDDDDAGTSHTSVLSNAQRKQRRQTQFIARPVQPPSESELQKKLEETEKALEEEEKMRSESELEVNKLHQVIAEKVERIRELDALVHEKMIKLLEYERKCSCLEKSITVQAQQMDALEERQKENANNVLLLQEEKEILEAKMTELEVERDQEVEHIKNEMKDLKRTWKAMKLERTDMEKQRDEALQKLAENTGHLNHAQKIHYVENMKNEMNSLRNELTSLKSFIRSKGIRVPEKDKENKIPALNYRW